MADLDRAFAFYERVLATTIERETSTGTRLACSAVDGAPAR